MPPVASGPARDEPGCAVPAAAEALLLAAAAAAAGCALRVAVLPVA